VAGFEEREARTAAVFNAAFSILPGKIWARRAVARETMGAGRSDFE